jgi:hypothetical protein
MLGIGATLSPEEVRLEHRPLNRIRRRKGIGLGLVLGRHGRQGLGHESGRLGWLGEET